MNEPSNRPLFLASRSPRRRALLGQLGVAFEVLDVDVPEVAAPGESPLAYVERVARAKASAGLAIARSRRPDAVVLGADTEVVLDGRIFGKPTDAAAAAGMLRVLSGRTHAVVSVVCCARSEGAEVAVCRSQVTFADLGEPAIARYIEGTEWADKAGGYAIQGAAAAFVAHLDGSHSGVVGLPLFETAILLRQAGVLP